jgi:hypothetical protein
VFWKSRISASVSFPLVCEGLTIASVTPLCIQLLKELTSGQMMRQKVEREAEATARELKAAQDMLYMVNERAEREQAGHSVSNATATAPNALRLAKCGFLTTVHAGLLECRSSGQCYHFLRHMFIMVHSLMVHVIFAHLLISKCTKMHTMLLVPKCILCILFKVAYYTITLNNDDL